MTWKPSGAIVQTGTLLKHGKEPIPFGRLPDAQGIP